VPASSASKAVEWAARCRAEGLAVGCFRPPSVRRPRLRLTARADLTDTHVAWAVETVVRTAPCRP
jgi:8-amino-7-oxononanoate synthase